MPPPLTAAPSSGAAPMDPTDEPRVPSPAHLRVADQAVLWPEAATHTRMVLGGPKIVAVPAVEGVPTEEYWRRRFPDSEVVLRCSNPPTLTVTSPNQDQAAVETKAAQMGLVVIKRDRWHRMARFQGLWLCDDGKNGQQGWMSYECHGMSSHSSGGNFFLDVPPLLALPV